MIAQGKYEESRVVSPQIQGLMKDQKKMRAEFNSLKHGEGAILKKTDSINWPIYCEYIDGETLGEYVAKVSFIHFNSIEVNFIDRCARNEQQGSQLNISLVCQNSGFIPASVPLCDRHFSGCILH